MQGRGRQGTAAPANCSADEGSTHSGSHLPAARPASIPVPRSRRSTLMHRLPPAAGAGISPHRSPPGLTVNRNVSPILEKTIPGA